MNAVSNDRSHVILYCRNIYFWREPLFNYSNALILDVAFVCIEGGRHHHGVSGINKVNVSDSDRAPILMNRASLVIPHELLYITICPFIII